MPIRSATLFLLLLLVHARAQAQDTIVYVSGSVIAATVEEIGPKTIRYKTWSAENPVAVTADRAEIARIKLHSGQEFVITAMSSAQSNERLFARKQAISFDVLAPALNHVTMGYERQLSPQTNIQVKLGYIGLMQVENYSQLFNSRGGLLKVGVKLRLPTSPRRIASGRTLHGLAGWYIRPELMVSTWEQRRRYYGYYDPYYQQVQYTNAQYTSAAFVLNFGNQWLLGDRITFDLYSGLGYGVQWSEVARQDGYEYYFSQEPYSFSHSFIGTISPLVVTGGMMFGFVF